MFKIIINNIEHIEQPKSSNHRLTTRTIFSEIWVDLNRNIFPHPDWSDATSSILDMWSTEIICIAKKQTDTCRLYFMDGPYYLELRMITAGIAQISFVNDGKYDSRYTAQTVPLNEIITTLVNTIDSFTSYCCNANADFKESHLFQCLIKHRRDLEDSSTGSTGDSLREPF